LPRSIWACQIYCWACDCDISGCTDSSACNYNPEACADDETCVYLSSNEGTVFYDLCDDGVEYYFIRLTDGTVIDPYNTDEVNFDYPDGATVEFGYSVIFDSPCTMANMAVEIMCIEIKDQPECDYTAKGKVFYSFCDDGIEYYLIELSDGSIVDPYDNFDTGDFNYHDGASVEFTYGPTGSSPCSIAGMAVEIICIREAGGQCNPNPEIFSTYPFLEALVDPGNCKEESISVSGYFIIVESASGRSLYLDNGTFFCDYESCIDYYLPGGAPCVWGCEGNTAKSKNNTNLSLKKKAEPFIEIFPNPNNGQFTLKINSIKDENQQSEVQLFNSEGKLLKTINNSNNQTTIDVSGFGKGVYMLSVTSAGLHEVKKLIIN